MLLLLLLLLLLFTIVVIVVSLSLQFVIILINNQTNLLFFLLLSVLLFIWFCLFTQHYHPLNCIFGALMYFYLNFLYSFIFIFVFRYLLLLYLLRYVLFMNNVLDCLVTALNFFRYFAYVLFNIHYIMLVVYRSFFQYLLLLFISLNLLFSAH